MNALISSDVEPGCLAIVWLGQAGFALKGHAGHVVVVDPYLSDSANTDGNWPRLQPIPITPEDIRLDYLLLTHDHLDHTDPMTAPLIARANPNSPIVAPGSSVKHLVKLGIPATQIVTAVPGREIVFPGLRIHPVPAEHTEDSVGYVLAFSNLDDPMTETRVYVTGDSEYNDRLAPSVSAFEPQVLMVPINGRWGNMTAAQAATLTRQIMPEQVIPMHYGMFAGNTADPNDYVAALASYPDTVGRVVPVVLDLNVCHMYQ